MRFRLFCLIFSRKKEKQGVIGCCVLTPFGPERGFVCQDFLEDYFVLGKLTFIKYILKVR